MSRFFDTNILVYANGNDYRAPIARHEMTMGGTISVQVLSEFANVMRKKMRRSWLEIEEAIADIESSIYAILPLTREIQRKAFAIAATHNLSIYDSLIVASALHGKCNEIISEDLQHGRRFEGLTVRNPFLEN